MAFNTPMAILSSPSEKVYFNSHIKNLQNNSQKFIDQVPGTTQLEDNSIYLNYKFIIFFKLKLSLCWW